MPRSPQAGSAPPRPGTPAVHDRCPPGGPQRGRGAASWGSRSERSVTLGRLSRFPSRFAVLPGRWLHRSFCPLGAPKFHREDAAGRAPGARVPPAVPPTFLAKPPAQLGRRVHLLLGSRRRWKRRGGREAVHRPAGRQPRASLSPPGAGRELTLCLTVCLLLRLLGFLEINSHCCFPEQPFICFASPLPSPCVNTPEKESSDSGDSMGCHSGRGEVCRGQQPPAVSGLIRFFLV